MVIAAVLLTFFAAYLHSVVRSAGDVGRPLAAAVLAGGVAWSIGLFVIAMTHDAILQAALHNQAGVANTLPRCRRLTPSRCMRIRAPISIPATLSYLESAALQFVRKISGYRKPSHANQPVFDAAVEEIAIASQRLLAGLNARAARGEPRGPFITYLIFRSDSHCILSTSRRPVSFSPRLAHKDSIVATSWSRTR